MDLGLRGKVAVVTAASGGLGRAIAEEFAAEGAITVIAARNTARLEATAAEIARKTAGTAIPFLVTEPLPLVTTRSPAPRPALTTTPPLLPAAAPWICASVTRVPAGNPLTLI